MTSSLVSNVLGLSGISDAHFHMWDTSSFELAWLPGAPWLPTTVTLSDYETATAGIGITRAVPVQAGESLAEATWLENHTATNPLTPGVVLQFDHVPGTWAGAVESVVTGSKGPRIRGIRLPIHGKDMDWSGLDGLRDLLENAGRLGLVIELLVRPDQLKTAGWVASQFPAVQFVLCHLGLSVNDPDNDWAEGLTDFGSQHNASAKVSGLFRPGVDRGQDDARVQAAVGVALDVFGPSRIMFGSDWPMSARIGSYQDILERTVAALGGLGVAPGSAEIQAIFDGSARDRYRL